MTNRFPILIFCLLVEVLCTRPAKAAETLWTAIIARGFPDTMFTWHLEPDGRYREDGNDMVTGAPIQPTLSGHWTVSGTHMVLRQEGISYVFDGDVTGDVYRGMLYLDGKALSRFCAAKGKKPPRDCDMSV